MVPFPRFFRIDDKGSMAAIFPVLLIFRSKNATFLSEKREMSHAEQAEEAESKEQRAKGGEQRAERFYVVEKDSDILCDPCGLE